MKRLLPLLILVVIPVLLYAKDYVQVTFDTENAGNIPFDHQVHLKKLGNNCTVCHNTLYSVGRSKQPVTMAEMEKGKSCGFCHNKTRAFALSECTRCHPAGEVAIKVPNFGTVPFSHKVHLGMYTCSDCHTAIFKPGPGNPHVSMAQMEQGVSCGVCHDGKTAFTVKETCTKCHPVRDITFAADALFSHAFHLEMQKCGDCHSKLFIAGPNSVRYSMQDMEKGRSCGGCHNASSAFSVKADCDKCHKSPKEVSFKEADAHFSHQFHLKIYRCADCHSGIFVGGSASKRYPMAEMERDRSCGACHDGAIAFSVTGSCNKCHPTTKNKIFTITNAGTVTFSHEVHQGMYGCSDCHYGIFTTGKRARRYSMADMASGKSCGACHDGKTAFSASATCNKCHPAPEKVLPADAHFSHVKHYEMYSCTECHNKLFVAGHENRRYTMPDMEKGKSCGACHDGKSAFGVTSSCDKCHKSTIEVSLKVPSTGATPFSHKVHSAAYQCADCHNSLFTTGVAAKRYSMADMEGGKSCGACHDGSSAFTVKENCQRCHPVKEITYRESGAFFSHKFHTGMFRCTDCHPGTFKPFADKRRSTMPDMEQGRSCGACHDDKNAFGVTTNCEKCHNVTRAIKYEMQHKSTGEVIFSHKMHLGKGYGCADCHYKVFNTGVRRKSFKMRDMNEGKSCGACHGFSMAFSVKPTENCDRCHNRDIFAR